MSFADSTGQSYGLVSGTPVADESETLVSGSARTSNAVPAKLASMPMIGGARGGYYDNGPVAGGNACYAPGCDVSWYTSYEAMWLKREGDENFTMSRFNRMPAFDYELGEIGGRITAGRLFDCTNGIEGIFTGPFKWRRTSTF